jgi:periplasmic protein TonB
MPGRWPVHSIDATRPRHARLSEEGRVIATITIGVDGRMSDIQVTQSSGFERLDGAAECVVRNLRFNPGKRDGQPVEAQASLPITFKLE